VADPPEIGIKSGTTLSVPLTVQHDAKQTYKLKVKADVPAGWKISGGTGELLLPAEETTNLHVEIETPVLSEAELRSAKPQPIKLEFEGDGLQNRELVLNVLLRPRALPQ
jgi:hypothetical protein